jgi:hypothetical protein
VSYCFFDDRKAHQYWISGGIAGLIGFVVFGYSLPMGAFAIFEHHQAKRSME